jgi:hypothetical protein
LPKSWTQKFRGAKPAHVVELEKPFAGVAAGQRLFIPSPALLAERIAALPRGARTDPVALRSELASTHGADATCPVTTAIHLRIVAEHALEQIAAGAEPTPFWRAIPPESPVAKKLSCGPEFIRQKREAEATN